MIAVTCRGLCPCPFFEQLELVASAGPELVILREKDLPHEEYVRLAAGCLEICSRHGVPMAVNSDVEAAREIGAAAIHLPLHVLRSAEISGFERVGASVHSVAEASEAEQLGADYLIAGHVFPTACKVGEPRGTAFLKDVCSSVSIPVYGIGGITPSNYADVLSCGAAGAAVMSSVMGSDDPAAVIRALKAIEP